MTSSGASRLGPTATCRPWVPWSLTTRLRRSRRIPPSSSSLLPPPLPTHPPPSTHQEVPQTKHEEPMKDSAKRLPDKDQVGSSGGSSVYVEQPRSGAHSDADTALAQCDDVDFPPLTANVSLDIPPVARGRSHALAQHSYARRRRHVSHPSSWSSPAKRPCASEMPPLAAPRWTMVREKVRPGSRWDSRTVPPMCFQFEACRHVFCCSGLKGIHALCFRSHVLVLHLMQPQVN